MIKKAIILLSMWSVCLYGDQNRRMEKLFASLSPHESAKMQAAKAPHTFVFFVQGAADHYVPTNPMPPFGKWRNVDRVDVERIVNFSKGCGSCNILLLHIQRGGSHWYTANKPWASYLHVFSGGKKTLERHVKVLNGADPFVLQSLLKSARDWFPASRDYHLVYRGHGFFPDYEPNNVEKRKANAAMGIEIRPFDGNFPDTEYGIDFFAHSVRKAKVPLDSISMAACQMDQPEVRKALKGLSKDFIATDHSVLETLSAGFNFSFLTAVQGRDSGEDVTHKIRSVLIPSSSLLAKTEGNIFTSFGEKLPAPTVTELAKQNALKKGIIRTLSKRLEKHELMDLTEIKADLRNKAKQNLRLSARHLKEQELQDLSSTELAHFEKGIAKIDELSSKEDILAAERGILAEAMAAHPYQFYVGKSTQVRRDFSLPTLVSMGALPFAFGTYDQRSLPTTLLNGALGGW